MLSTPSSGRERGDWGLARKKQSCGSGSGMRCFLTPGSGIRDGLKVRIRIRDEQHGIRDGKNSDLGTEINIPDPQHWIKVWIPVWQKNIEYLEQIVLGFFVFLP
jgi:hypothetical protein